MIFILYPLYQKVLKAHRLSLSGSVTAMNRGRLSDSSMNFFTFHWQSAQQCPLSLSFFSALGKTTAKEVKGREAK